MEPPVAFDADSVREESAGAAIDSSHETGAGRRAHVRAQYGPGTIDGEKVKGYKEEEGVRKDSQTETYAAVEFQISNWRWSGVPFYVRTGKAGAQHDGNRGTPEAHAAGVVCTHA